MLEQAINQIQLVQFQGDYATVFGGSTKTTSRALNSLLDEGILDSWSANLFPLAKRTREPLPADVFGIYFSELKRIAHCGLVESKNGNWIATIEGNTNISGSREGDGVHRKLRHQRTIKYFANWIKQKGAG